MRYIIASVLLLTTSCACWTPEKRNTPACVIAHGAIECADAGVKEAAQKLLPVLEHILTGANDDPNWEQYLIALESLGLQAVSCAAQTVVDNLLTLAAAQPDPGDYSPMMAARASRVQRAENAKVRLEKWRLDRLQGATIKAK